MKQNLSNNSLIVVLLFTLPPAIAGFVSFFLLWGGMLALRPASQGGLLRNPRDGIV